MPVNAAPRYAELLGKGVERRATSPQQFEPPAIRVRANLTTTCKNLFRRADFWPRRNGSGWVGFHAIDTLLLPLNE
jgi:hypothetical protein